MNLNETDLFASIILIIITNLLYFGYALFVIHSTQ